MGKTFNSAWQVMPGVYVPLVKGTFMVSPNVIDPTGVEIEKFNAICPNNPFDLFGRVFRHIVQYVSATSGEANQKRWKHTEKTNNKLKAMIDQLDVMLLPFSKCRGLPDGFKYGDRRVLFIRNKEGLASLLSLMEIFAKDWYALWLHNEYPKDATVECAVWMRAWSICVSHVMTDFAAYVVLLPDDYQLEPLDPAAFVDYWLAQDVPETPPVAVEPEPEPVATVPEKADEFKTESMQSVITDHSNNDDVMPVKRELHNITAAVTVEYAIEFDAEVEQLQGVLRLLDIKMGGIWKSDITIRGNALVVKCVIADFADGCPVADSLHIDRLKQQATDVDRLQRSVTDILQVVNRTKEAYYQC